ncbi:CPBP family intramembrane metalloprotease [Synechocystis sp. PCC 7339]|uniref:CPBP family intramembrane glutamic endopeptidase n=1 Tax=unclassified Synechocystis TaxID=2640012 RepID=UPI001BAF10DC|nr:MULTISPECIES: CPBP family intramembrane glutamic endopeptidase [unclassified Synechocystis]QUS60216.1 CPBP family intramembrane metalloprotease [Synechocystis sp. PCC 7338]UAJ72339.1 CPBP family intramembrane metalloprotease [Synechocystis sp. PCC 7339]
MPKSVVNFRLNGQAMARLAPPLRMGVFILLLALAWLPFLLPLSLAIADANLRSIVVMGILFLIFLVLLIFWSHWCYQTPLSLKAYGEYGLGWNRRQGLELLRGLGLGFGFTSGLFIIQALLGWAVLEPAGDSLWVIILQGSLTGLGVALAEELFFRGWLLKELDQGYSRGVALGSNAVIFAVLHFLKPLGEVIRTLPQFPALVLLGLSLVVTKRRHGDRLGHCIGLHGGLVWAYYIINVGQLVSYTDRVPTWVTGIDQNPLSGVMGIAGLSLLLWLVSRGQKASV